MPEPTPTPNLHVLSCEEIEMYLKGDRREIDRLILMSINRLTDSFITHYDKEELIHKDISDIGGLKTIKERAAYVDSLILKNNKRSEMMTKVSQSGLAWALIAFFGFVAVATWDALIHAIKVKLGG